MTTNYLSFPKFVPPRCGDSIDTVSQTSVPLELKNHKDRWNHMSELAGPHRQDDSELTLDRPISPQVFKCGVPSGVAARVKRLHIFVEGDHIPEWLDVLSSNCFELQHLQFSPCPEERGARTMRRLYILYRLPDLKSIDGETVTDVERQLARPDTPNGERVDRKEWVQDAMLDDDDENSDDVDSNVEVSLFGLVKPVNADPPTVSFDEPEWELPYYPPEKPAVITSSTSTKRRTETSPLNVLCSRNEKYYPKDEEKVFVVNNLSQPYPLKSCEENNCTDARSPFQDDETKQSSSSEDQADDKPANTDDKHERRRKRVLGRWRDRTQFRATSMMDRDCDSEEEDPDKIIVH